MLGLLDTAGFPLPEADRALNTVTAYATDIAMGEAAWHNWLTRHDQTQQDWIDHAMSVAEEATTEDYPRLRTVVAGYAGKEPQRAMDDDFDYGLERVLDGSKPASTRPRSSPRTVPAVRPWEKSYAASACPS